MSRLIAHGADAKLRYIDVNGQDRPYLLDGDPISGVPTKTSDLINDSDFATSGYVIQSTSGKLDNPTGGSVGQILVKTATAAEWTDNVNLSFIPIEIKSKGEATSFVVDFTGKAIQKYNIASSISGTLAIDFTNTDEFPENTVPTIELQVPITGNVSTITLPANVQPIDIPDSIEYVSAYTYCDFVFRIENDFNDEPVIYANFAYQFIEKENE